MRVCVRACVCRLCVEYDIYLYCQQILVKVNKTTYPLLDPT